MRTVLALMNRNRKLFFKDKGMLFTSMITPVILIVLYATFLAKVFRDSFTAAIPDMITISDKLIDGTVAAQLTASLMAVSCITVTFCVNLTMVQDKANGTRKDFNVAPVSKEKIYLGYFLSTVANSLMVGCAKLGMNYVACCPEADAPDSELVEKCRAIAAENDCTVTVTSDVDEGTKGAHVIYTDIWVSMGEPASLWEQRIKELSPYQVNAKVMANAADNAIFMHCLPAFHDTKTTVAQEIEEKFGLTEMEVTDEVFEGAQSRVFDEAENRMHSIKAVVLATLR